MAASTCTSPPAYPPVQVTVAPCDRVMVDSEFVLVSASGVCTLTAALNGPISLPPEPVKVYTPGASAGEPDSCAWYNPGPPCRFVGPFGAVNWMAPASKGVWSGFSTALWPGGTIV